MGLNSPDKVDYLALAKEDGGLLLALVDDFTGEDQRERFRLIQAKVYRYLDFIDSGEVYEAAEREFGRPLPRTIPARVRIYAMTGFDEEGRNFILHVQEVARQEGVEVDVELRAE